MANPTEREEIFLLLIDQFPVLYLAPGYERDMGKCSLFRGEKWPGWWWNDKMCHMRDR